jgi:hypothetical protein
MRSITGPCLNSKPSDFTIGCAGVGLPISVFLSYPQPHLAEQVQKPRLRLNRLRRHEPQARPDGGLPACRIPGRRATACLCAERRVVG